MASDHHTLILSPRPPFPTRNGLAQVVQPLIVYSDALQGAQTTLRRRIARAAKRGHWAKWRRLEDAGGEPETWIEDGVPVPLPHLGGLLVDSRVDPVLGLPRPVGGRAAEEMTQG
ncbi:hypothetical protein NDU88_002269 [Pleurodeles waltl]|uniref:Uncharacterized protein n=1 Tax=Pleurodeles waltl TaxID=8319 RepID=A0AAV7WPQ1_PLEWA|nr:hypothetical protein NDU88_002269 [Pleurodeles waltl]